MNNKTLLYITGPTAIGKSKISIFLAKKLNSERLHDICDELKKLPKNCN